MSLMGSLYIGVSGLQTSQNALNTTAHNLSNQETEGYVRQQTLLEDRFYHNIGNAGVSAMYTGLGVEYAEVRQVRDDFLDMSYREEKGRQSFYDVAYETTGELETLLGELEGASFKEALSNYWTSVEELQKDPTSAVVQGQFVTTGLQFLERAQAVYDGLSNYQNNLDARVKDQVKQINEYGEQIHKLNGLIKGVEVGPEEANDLRDQRNLILDKLSSLCKISYTENIDRVVEVSIEGTPFVARDRVFEMGTEIDPTSGYTIPVWPWNNDQEVFDLNTTISSALDTDIGELKSILLMRGDRRGNYSDMGDREINGNTFHVYDDGYTDVSGNRYMATSNSMTVKIQAQLDKLVHSVATNVNDILCGEAGKDPLDRYYANEEDLPIEMFRRLGENSRYEYRDGTDTTTAPHGAGWYYIEENNEGSPADVSTMYTLTNLKINPDLLKEPTLLSFVTKDKQADQAKADALVEAFRRNENTLTPHNSKEYDYSSYYDALVSGVGNEGFIYKTFATSQESTVTSLENARQQVIGVSSNEELSNMIRFQNAYNAASRYINAVNDMLAHLVTSLT